MSVNIKNKSDAFGFGLTAYLIFLALALYHAVNTGAELVYVLTGIVMGVIGSALIMFISIYHNEDKINCIDAAVKRIEGKIKCSGTNQCRRSITPIMTKPTKCEIEEHAEEVRWKLQEISEQLDQISKQTPKATGRGKMPKGY